MDGVTYTADTEHPADKEHPLDAWGNLINDGVYTYNADGLRVAQDMSGTTTAFVWDWATPVPELVLSVVEGKENVYLVGLDTVGWWDGEAWTFALPDALGSVRQTTDITGTVTDSREWSPFGVEIDGAQAGLGYTGEWWDDGAGLLYLRARWYDARTGRFTAQDPWEGTFWYPKSLQQWSYVYASPVNYTDPSGRCIDEDLDGICDDPATGFVYDTLLQWGGVNDLEAMASICEVYARAYPTWGEFLDEMSEVFIGVDTHGPGTLVNAAIATAIDGCVGVGRERRDCEWNFVSFADRGFHPDYRDQHNQPYHVWGFIAQIAYPESLNVAINQCVLEAHLGNVFHDIFQSKRFLGAFVGKGYGASWQDYFLSLAGMELGMDIASGDIATPHELCPALHTRLGPAGPGSDGAVDWWRTHWDIHPDAVPDIMPLACMTSEWGIECLPDWSWGPDYE